MSSYIQVTKHPRTGLWEEADWLDDYFGPRQYGVRFPSDDMIFRATGHDWEIMHDVKPTRTRLIKDRLAKTKGALK